MTLRIVLVAADSSEEPEVLEWPPKDPDELLDYGLDWSARILSGDQLAASTWVYQIGSPEIPVTLQSFDANTGVTKLWLSGGVLDKTYYFTNRVTTDEDRVMDQTVSITIRKK